MNNRILFKSVYDSGYDITRIYAEKAACADLSQEVCPYCGNAGCTRHGYYPRQCRDVSDGQIIARRFRMLRAKCRTCGRTHAVRFGLFMTRCLYSTALIQEVCNALKEASNSIKRIWDSLPLAPRTICRWKKKTSTDCTSGKTAGSPGHPAAA